MKALKTVGLWLFALTLATVPAVADDDSRAVAQELVALTMNGSGNDIIGKISAAMWPGIQATLPKTLDDATVAELRGVFDRTIQKYVADAIKVAPDIYARHFSTDELRGLLAFYKTPIGAKALSEMPKVMGDFTTTALVPMMAPMQSELKANVEAVLRAHSQPK